MERHLAATHEEADALVDLSNVLRDERLGGHHPRSLHRLRLVLDALADRAGDRAVRVHAVADRSLRRAGGAFPGPAEPALLARWAGRGLIEEAGDADEPLLDLAEVTGLPVISRDDFRDFRTSHPWIQGNTTQFLAPAREGDRVVLRERDMGIRTPAQISRKIEESDLKAHGLLAGRHRRPMREIVTRHWRCPERGCALYDRRRGSQVRLPLMRHGVPVCELHRAPLADDGPRTGIVQLKLLVDGACVHRFTLDADTTVEIGRAPDAGGIALYRLLPEELARRVSRRHLIATVTGGDLTLRNLSSRGTRLLRPGAPGPVPLSADRGVPFHVNDIAELTPGAALTRSARRYPAEIAAAWRRSGAKAPARGPAHADTEWL
ncbi:FHA domain-containing protein [Streptomyces hoynatensis]|uniref:FHA domain-containing protein n=1 Tax=Streptomyces hoynatensis TaxID=1141874 RepID=A0A3A9YXV6_9ACTN|nr:FHA domain-containing protein [Streptomyces hoynatensis]